MRTVYSHYCSECAQSYLALDEEFECPDCGAILDDREELDFDEMDLANLD